jgi:diadenosine tetraphosphatase ApaH/serine/threonine PP2A family protein phosphatase
VDEGLDPALDGLELIADVAEEMRFEGPVLCGHACSLASRGPDDVARIADKLAPEGSPWPRCLRRTSTCRAVARARPTGGDHATA